MDYSEFLNKAIDEGIDAVHTSYEKGTDKFNGSIDGFEACRNCSPEDLLKLYHTASEYMNRAYREEANNYWYFRCYQAEVEWICNVVSAILINEGRESLLSWLPTCNGTLKADSILKSK